MSGLTAEALNKLQLFLGAVKKNPDLFYLPELSFFKDFVESYGGTVPPQSKASREMPKTEPTSQPEQSSAAPEEEESEESDLELDNTGVLENPDAEEPIPEIVVEQEVSEENMDKSNEKKREAIHAFNDAKYEEAVNAYTEAIALNPVSALLYAKRGQSYLQLSKPNACIRDCTVALQINPDIATAYKFRGRAYRLLGKWEEAAKDLRNACKIDFDEQTDEWLKEVTPNAKKLEEHQRKYERKRVEKELKEKQERILKAKKEHVKAAQAAPPPEADFDFGGGAPPDFMKIFNDPELAAAFKDPETMAAFSDITSNPANIINYQNNPKLMNLITKISSLGGLGGAGAGGFPGMGGVGSRGFPGMGGRGGDFSGDPPSHSPTSGGGQSVPDDIGLD